MSRVLLIHVSDIHFGSEFYANRNSVPNARNSSAPPPPAAPKRTIPGLAAHDVGACEELENEILALKSALRPDQTVLVVSGDLTVLGEASEFAMAHTFLRSRIQATWMRASGLGDIVDSVVAVPGNHDHLRGHLSRTIHRSRPSTGVYPFFEPTRSANANCWWIHHVIDVDRLCLQIGGLDSCGASSGQPFATGSLDLAALTELETVMHAHPSPPGSHVVRLLVLHHALDPASSPSLKQRLAHQTHKLDDASRRALETFCAQTNTQFVLTGHLHVPGVPQKGAQLRPGMEIRCGTSLQEGPQRKLGQIFMAHVIEARTRPHWTTRVFQRLPIQRSFVEATSWQFQASL